MSEQKLEVFNVLNFLNNGYELEDILNQGQFGTFSSAEECINYLVDEGYLKGDVDVTANVEITAEYISKKYIVSELKDILRENGLKVSGKKLNKEENRTLKNMVEYAELHNGQPLYERNKDGQMVKFKYEIITTHTARRSGVTNLYKTGLLDTRDMMSISGHKSEATFEHYIKMKKSEHADRIAEKHVRKLLKKVL